MPLLYTTNKNECTARILIDFLAKILYHRKRSEILNIAENGGK